MQNRRPSNDFWGKGDRRRQRPEIIYVVRPNEDNNVGKGENRRRERPQDQHRQRPRPVILQVLMNWSNWLTKSLLFTFVGNTLVCNGIKMFNSFWFNSIIHINHHVQIVYRTFLLYNIILTLNYLSSSH